MNINLAERLLSARKTAGLSLQDLADKLKAGITKQALNKYEHGKAKPSGEVLLQIANALKVPADYFYRSSTVKLQDIEFRKQARLGRRDIEQIKGEVADTLERYFELEDLLNINHEFKCSLQGFKINSKEDIEEAARKLRKEWQLGNAPLPGVFELLEEKQIKIFEVEAEDSFAGMFAKVNNIPVIVINKKNNPPQRKRFTALHELGHLLLDLSAFEHDEKEQEKLCHNFAGAMLLPKDVFIERVGEKRTSISLKELMMIDEYYGISVQAIMARAKSLEIISEPTYRAFNMQVIAAGMKKKDYVEDYCVKEEPRRFTRLLYKAISEEIISMSKAAALSNKRLAEFREELAANG